MLTTEPSATVVKMNSVLVADDDTISRTILESCLRDWQFEVIIAKDGLAAWHELQKETAPNLIILDWMMPGFSGIELCREIRARKTRPHPYILLLTSKSEKQELVEGLDAGADDYLIKPLHTSELQARLRVGKRILGLQQELMAKEEEMRILALHDRLTGLWNRGAILDFMERELAISRRQRNSIGVLMVDVDHFKTINDTYGHQVGDAILRQVGKRLAHGMRASDWIGRYGGEEFLSVLASCNEEILALCAERIRRAISSEAFCVGNLKVTVTVSVGTALSSMSDSLTCSQLVAIADAALYRAKHQGRNCVDMGLLDYLLPLPKQNLERPEVSV